MSDYKGPKTKEYYFNKNYRSNNYNEAKEICRSRGYGWDVADFGFIMENKSASTQEIIVQDYIVRRIM